MPSNLVRSPVSARGPCSSNGQIRCHTFVRSPPPVSGPPHECVPVAHDRDGNHCTRRRDGARFPSGGALGVPCGPARAGVVERLSAAAVRHRRVSRALVRRLSRAQPLHGVRAFSPRRGRTSFLARAPPAGRMHGLGDFAGAAGVRTWRRTVALGHCCCRSRVCHGIAIPRQHAADRHFCRACGPFAASRHLSSRGARASPAGGAIAAGAAMLIAANVALSGQVAWTPGGFGIAFGRMLQDGIVKRYLDDHCPDARLKLCPYRNELPTNADDFLWSYGVFNKLGRFSGLGEEMRFIVLHSLQEYPLRQVETAVAATASQLALVATGHGTHDRIWHTYGIVKRFIPGEVRAMQQARQQHGELHFDLINRLHVPIALGSMLVLLVLLANALVCRCFDAPASLAATVTVALLATAFVD